MTGMGRGVSLHNEIVTSHFISALFFDVAILIGLIAVAVVVLLWVGRRQVGVLSPGPEQPARRVLRIGTGGLWIVAGLLQLQTSMPMGLPAEVVRPSVASAPGWASWSGLQATDAWIRHPILGATGVVWLELGLGLWLVLARRGWLSRFAGGASALWALLVFLVGSGFGGVFVAPWAWAFGAPEHAPGPRAMVALFVLTVIAVTAYSVFSRGRKFVNKPRLVPEPDLVASDKAKPE